MLTSSCSNASDRAPFVDRAGAKNVRAVSQDGNLIAIGEAHGPPCGKIELDNLAGNLSGLGNGCVS